MDNDMDLGDQNTQSTSPYHVEDYKTQVPYAPPPPQRPSRRWWLLLLLLIPLIVVGAAIMMQQPTPTPIAASVTATTAPTATDTPVVPTATIAATPVPATTAPASPQPTDVPTVPAATPPVGGAVVVTISPTNVTVTCGNATTTVTLTNPSATQTAQWQTVATPLYTLTPGSGTLAPHGQQDMAISHINAPGVVIVVSSGVSQTITITCNVGALAQKRGSSLNA